MGNSFVVAVEGGTGAQYDTITFYFQRRKWHFWHWIDNVWLLTGLPETESASSLKDELAALPHCGDLAMLVLATIPSSYSGFLPPPAHDWLRANWTNSPIRT